MPCDTPETRRDVSSALEGLDEEAYMFVIAQLWQLARGSGGFRDKAGWLRVREACENVAPELRDDHGSSRRTR